MEGANGALDVPLPALSSEQRNQRCDWHLEAGAAESHTDKDMVMLVATERIEEGEEIIIDYGSGNQQSLLRSYGFIDPRCPVSLEQEAEVGRVAGGDRVLATAYRYT